MDAIGEHARGLAAIRRRVPESILGLAVVAGLLFLAQAFVIQAFTVSSASMLPTLLPGDSVLVNRLVYHLHPPRRGDIIVFHFPQADGREFVKRVIGVPGDVVREGGGRLYVNGALLAQAQTIDSNAQLEPEGSQLPRLVPAGRLYALGDNSEASLDSRFWGTVDERDVIGKAFLICWSRGKHWWEVRWNRIGRWLP
jgi:signal peptidase I